jgi:hypothetical protein
MNIKFDRSHKALIALIVALSLVGCVFIINDAVTQSGQYFGNELFNQVNASF